MRGACAPLTWWPWAEATADPERDCLRGNARLLKAADMRLKTSRSDARGPADGGGGGYSPWGGGGRPAVRAAPLWIRWRRDGRGHQPGAVGTLCRRWGGERISIPPARSRGALISRALPVRQEEVRRMALRGPGVVWPKCGTGAGTGRLCWCRAPAWHRGAGAREGLEGRAGPPQPGAQCGRPCALVLKDEHLASWRNPGRGPREAWARQGISVSFVACLAAAADAPAQASASGARQRPMLQAQRDLCATARPRRAAALRGCEMDASTQRPWGPPGIREQSPPPPPPSRECGK